MAIQQDQDGTRTEAVARAAAADAAAQKAQQRASFRWTIAVLVTVVVAVGVFSIYDLWRRTGPAAPQASPPPPSIRESVRRTPLRVAGPGSFTVVDKAVQLAPKSFEGLNFSVHARGHLTGTFSSSCACSTDDSGIQVLVLEPEQFDLWRNCRIGQQCEEYDRHATAAIYNSMYSSGTAVDVRLADGSYVLVFTNDPGSGRPSQYPKTVTAKIELSR